MPLTALLPKPTQVAMDPEKESDIDETHRALSQPVAVREPPPYGKRRGWIPRSLEDFGDGGAFPEIHVAQYPLNMGKKKTSNSTAVVPLQLDAEGKVKYDVIARMGQRKDKVVHSSLKDMVAKDVRPSDPELVKPDPEDVEKTTEETRKALEMLVQKKVTAAMPVRCAEKAAPAQYIRYTPSQQGMAYGSGSKQRIIRMVEAQKDPMEPPKFKTNAKIPRGPPSPPAPVLHSPTRKVTVKEQQDWKIPPCISNWKNPKGYTIPLDKRLAADGRGLQDHTINDNFAKLAQALYTADREARKAIAVRTQMVKKVLQKDREAKEEGLRSLAQKARDERAGIKTVNKGGAEEDEDVQERDQLRYDRHKERERERRLARAHPERRSKLERDKDRDVTEKIALGVPSGAPSQESLFDQRLFGQSKGIDSGFAGGQDDMYTVYDKPWRPGGGAADHIYRPSKTMDSDVYGDDVEKLISANRFQPARGFSGTEQGGQRQDGPVQFEQDTEEDPFGLNKFLTEAKKAKRPTEENSESGSRSKRSRY